MDEAAPGHPGPRPRIAAHAAPARLRPPPGFARRNPGDIHPGPAYRAPMESTERDGVRIHVLEPTGFPVTSSVDTFDLIGNACYRDVHVLAVPVERLAPEFLDLSSGVAGEVLQKAVNYRLKVAVVGDVADRAAASAALADFIRESNRGELVWFLPDAAALDSRLGPLREALAADGAWEPPAR